MTKRKLILENGQVFVGEAFGGDISRSGEVIFFTGMSGYQEMITDPCYSGKVVVMTYPTIGSYGINRDDFEAINPSVEGLIVNELTEAPSNFRSEENLDSYLKRHDIPGISGIDTRMLTRLIRDEGMMEGVITDIDTAIEDVSFNQACDELEKLEKVSISKAYIIPGRNKRVVVIDLGVKQSILRELTSHGCHITVVPYHFEKETIERFKPDAIILSSGPGNPEKMPQIIETVKSLKGKFPLLGIGVGYELIALAYGAKLRKLHAGQYGINIPVTDLKATKTSFTTMSHDYVVDEKELPSTLEVTHRSLSDGEVAGLQSNSDSTTGIQFHPEGAPGSNEMNQIFTTFLNQSVQTQSKNGGRYHA